MTTKKSGWLKLEANALPTEMAAWDKRLRQSYESTFSHSMPTETDGQESGAKNSIVADEQPLQC